MASNNIFKQEDRSRFLAEGANQRKTKQESDIVGIMDVIARKNALTDFKVVSSDEQKDGYSFKVSFKNFFKKTTHNGNVVVKFSEDQDKIKKELEDQIKAIPAEPEAPMPARATFDAKEVKFFKQGEVIYVRNAHIGDICSFAAADFNEKNKDLILQQIAKIMDNLSDTWNMTFTYQVPDLTKIEVIGEQKVEEPAVPKEKYETYLKDEKVETSAADKEFMDARLAKLSDKQRAVVTKQVTALQTFVENHMMEFLKKISTIEGATLLPTTVSPKFDINSNGSITGTFYVKSKLMHGNDYKIHIFPIQVKENKVSLPSTADVVDAIKKVKGMLELSDETISASVKNLVASIGSTDTIVKQASVSTEAQAQISTADTNGYGCMVQVNKTDLPESLKVGDIVYVDNIKYKVTSGDDGKLSERGEGVYWTLVMEKDSDKEPVSTPTR
jgi:hypothetical protein